MAMTPEAKVKNKAVKQLKEMGAYYFYPATAGFGKSGVPDIVACYKGLFFGIECKAGKNKATALQEQNLRAIHKAKGCDMVINEWTVGDLTTLMRNHVEVGYDRS
jgi:Holliday junction resolvase|tara:strand:- start:119 stop:433 length:315 start_codon:yes stop_codon:yes gene_type:complete